MNLSWVTIIWSAIASACLTIALVYLGIWLKRSREPALLSFPVVAISVAAIAIFELMMMRAQTPAEFGIVMRWTHIPVFTLVASLIAYVLFNFRAGSWWLAGGACALRLLSLILNFYFDPNLNYAQISGLRQIEMPGGELVSVAVGTASPRLMVGELSSLLLVIFLVHASIELWRRGGAERRHATIVGGSFALAVLIAAGHAALVHAGVVNTPYLISVPFLLIVMAMGYKLSSDVVQGLQLTARLGASEAELRRNKERVDSTDELLKNERAFLRQVIDVDPNLIFAKNRAGQFTLVNQAVADVFGTTVENIVGKTDADFSPNVAEIEHFRRIDNEVMDTLQEQFIAEEPITSASGKVLWLQTVKRPILDEDGTANQLLGSATDITRRKQAEIEVALQRNELAHLSRVAMLGELSGSLAHELNQPLTAILSNAQAAQRFLARDDVDLDEVRAILKDIVNDDKRAGEIIRGLRLLLTKGEMQRQPLDVNDVVSDVLRLVRSDLLNSGVSVHTDLAPKLPMPNGDRVQLQQVLINLVVNGCEAMTGVAGAVRQLSVRTAMNGAETVCVSVSDRGRGIPPEHLERVFDPFFTTKSHGLGLGLAVCRTIISAQGGRLWADNNAAASGASFHFSLPVTVAATA